MMTTTVPVGGAALAAGAIALLVLSFSAQAAWVVEPSFEISSSYDDNVRLTEDEEEEGTVSQATAQAELRNVTERSEVSALAGVSYLVYSGVDDLDDQDVEFFDLRARRNSERGEVGVRARARHDLLLRRLEPILDPLDTAGMEGEDGAPAIEDVDLDGDIDTSEFDLNTVREQVRRTRFSIEPYVEFAISERTRVRAELSYFERNFDSEGERAGLQDNNRQGGLVSLARDVTPLSTINLSASYDNLESARAPDADAYTATIGWESRVSPVLRLAVDLGATRTETDFGEETRFTYRASAARRTEVSRFLFNAVRTTVPSAFGGAIESDRLSLRYQRRLSERFEFIFGTYGFSSQRVGGDTAPDDRDYIEVSPEITYQLTQSWRIGAGYAYRWIEREQQDGTAQSSAVTLSLSYQPPTRL